MAVNKRARSWGSQNKVGYMAVKEKEDWKLLTFLNLRFFSLWIGVVVGTRKLRACLVGVEIIRHV